MKKVEAIVGEKIIMVKPASRGIPERQSWLPGRKERGGATAAP
jgi:hypothetical protein